MKEEKTEETGFYGLGIAPKILEILEQLKFKVPTPIQLKSIPVTIEGNDIVGIAQTGTGKTLAFGIPMIQRLAQHKGRGLIVLPTRELALQVDESLREIGGKLGLKTVVLIGGESISRQITSLRRNPHVIICTPGRLIDHLRNKQVNLNDVKILVLDEADMMFDMGFAPQIETILKQVPEKRQTMLFSATMPPAIMKVVTKYMALPIRIEVAPAGTAAENVSQEMLVVKADEKFAQLEIILKEQVGSILIFSRTKHGVKNLTAKLNNLGIRSAEIHSNRSLVQRREALAGFKNGRFRILVATDIAARGIDVKGIELVINYDLPDNSEDYVHRIGRTGRAGKTGRALSLVLPHELREVRNIERLINKKISISTRGSAQLGKSKEDFIERRGEGKRRFSKQGGRQGSGGQSGGGHNKFNKFKRKRPGGFRGREEGRNERSEKPMTDKERFRRMMRG